MTPKNTFRGYQASRRYAWYVVLLLTFTQVVSYIDRFLPSLLIQQIKADLTLTDFQVGLLLGPAFGLFYVFVGVPIGWMADRYSRRRILAAGIAIWCSMTAAAGLARSFVPLFGARLGVGLGEAAVAPCSVSLISDYFERRKRPMAISTFMAGTFIGAGTAFLLGGPVVYAVTQMPPISLPLVGELRTWQLAFFIEFLKLGGRFDQWVEDCPLSYTSNNAPKKIDAGIVPIGCNCPNNAATMPLNPALPVNPEAEPSVIIL